MNMNADTGGLAGCAFTPVPVDEVIAAIPDGPHAERKLISSEKAAS
jgi:hypothetical protein